jgi:hypothetical protein
MRFCYVNFGLLDFRNWFSIKVFNICLVKTHHFFFWKLFLRYIVLDSENMFSLTLLANEINLFLDLDFSIQSKINYSLIASKWYKSQWFKIHDLYSHDDSKIIFLSCLTAQSFIKKSAKATHMKVIKLVKFSKTNVSVFFMKRSNKNIYWNLHCLFNGEHCFIDHRNSSCYSHCSCCLSLQRD